MELQEIPTFRGEMKEERPIGNQKGVDRKKMRRSQGRGGFQEGGSAAMKRLGEVHSVHWNLSIELKLIGGIVRGDSFSVVVHYKGWNRESMVMKWKCVFVVAVC